MAASVGYAAVEVRQDGSIAFGVSACTEREFSRFVTIQSLKIHPHVQHVKNDKISHKIFVTRNARKTMRTYMLAVYLYVDPAGSGSASARSAVRVPESPKARARR